MLRTDKRSNEPRKSMAASAAGRSRQRSFLRRFLTHRVSSGSRYRCQLLSFLFVLVPLVGVDGFVAQLRGEEDGIILGRIRLRMNHDGTRPIGPVALRTDTATVFQKFAALTDRDAAQLSPQEINSILADRHFVLVSRHRPASPLLAQWESRTSNLTGANQGQLVWCMSDDAGEVPADVEYTLALREGAAPLRFSVADIDGKHLLVKYDNRPVLRYNYGIVRQRADRTGRYDRACYLHPVWTPSGAVVTGDFSPEHIHQRGIFSAWVKARFGDLESDFWGLGDSEGRMLPAEKAPQFFLGPVFTKLIVTNRGVIEDRTVFVEQVEVRVYAGEYAGGWLFDLRTTQAPVAGVPSMELPRVYYGGMSYRGPSHWLTENSRDVQRARSRGVVFNQAEWLPPEIKLDVMTSEGNDRIGGDRKAAKWIDYTGPLGNSWGGLAMFDYPANPRFPTPLRIHPELPYFSFAFVQRQPFTVDHDHPLELAYRVRIHDSRPDFEVNERIANSLRAAPAIAWLPGGGPGDEEAQ